MPETFTPRKAERKQVKLKMAIQGPSGSGKTEGALALATNFIPNAKVLVVDTENDSASLYADRYNFDTISLSAPYTSERYQLAIQAAITGGYDLLIIDSLSQQWDGDGGILRRKELADRVPGSNSYTNWAKFTPEHTRLVEIIKQLPIHTICTMRSKQDYILETNERGKQQPRKVGMAPIQRDGLEYEFTLVFDVNMAHLAIVSKNRTTLFGDADTVDLKNPEIAQALKGWLEKGILLPPQGDTVATEVYAEVERQKAQHAVAQPSTPPELDWSYQKTTGVLICRPTSAVKRKKKQGDGDYLTIGLNGEIEGKNIATYFHASHCDELMVASGKVCKFIIGVSKGNFLNIDEVLEIDGQKILSDERDAEAKARIVASILDFSEDDLQELRTKYCGWSWIQCLAKLNAEKERRDGLQEVAKEFAK